MNSTPVLTPSGRFPAGRNGHSGTALAPGHLPPNRRRPLVGAHGSAPSQEPPSPLNMLISVDRNNAILQNEPRLERARGPLRASPLPSMGEGGTSETGRVRER